MESLFFFKGVDHLNVFVCLIMTNYPSVPHFDYGPLNYQLHNIHEINAYKINPTFTHRDSIEKNTEHYNFFIPVMKALVDKTRGMLDMDSLLPSLPQTITSPTFFEDFKAYCQSGECDVSYTYQIMHRN